MASAASVEERLVALEREVARLRCKVEGQEQGERAWWKQIAGTFENDPYYAEAMKLGRQYRESLRPKKRKKKT